ncbi:ParB/RepB/Spo0J family partition protein [Candidatus Dojkabacteria bacterium]|nr:ParB/RepB/Spo0J family partition protein [Candidatus Dojkabacteria bacterium]
MARLLRSMTQIPPELSLTENWQRSLLTSLTNFINLEITMASDNQQANRLGKGLSALISSGSIDSTGYQEHFSINKIVPNPYQPRMNIDPDELIEIADSIREHGVIQPLLITKDNEAKDKDQYYLIAGERRFRASQLAGKDTVPVVIKDISPQEMLELALIENIQRQDLNPLEEALAFKQLADEFGLTHSEIAKKVGLNRVTITNKLRLLALPDSVKEYVMNNQLTEGHARALLGLSDESSLTATANIAVKRNLSVRETETLVRKINYSKQSSKSKIEELSKAEKRIEESLSKNLGYDVSIKKLSSGGKIVIKFDSDKDLDGLVKKLQDN